MPAPAPESEPAIVIAFGTADRESAPISSFCSIDNLVAGVIQRPPTNPNRPNPPTTKNAGGDGRRREGCPAAGAIGARRPEALPSLRRYEPDQVRRVGGAGIWTSRHALSALRTPGNRWPKGTTPQPVLVNESQAGTLVGSRDNRAIAVRSRRG